MSAGESRRFDGGRQVARLRYAARAMQPDRGSQRDVRGIAACLAALYFVQGLGDPASGVIAQPLRALLKSWGDEPAAIAGFMALLALPWSLKPLFALFADFVPWRGSHRRHYLLAVTAGASGGLVIVATLPFTAEMRFAIAAGLLLAAMAIAWSDVLSDALMIEFGQPRGLTGQLQALQWSALYLAMIAAGVLGGWFARDLRLAPAALVCACAWGACFALVLRHAREAPRPRDDWRTTAHALRACVRQPALLWLALFLFVWSFNPSWETVQYLHITVARGMAEDVYGIASSCFALGSLVAALAYGAYCRRLAVTTLLHLAIASALVSYLVYLELASPLVLYGVSALAGAANMTSNLALLDLAARRVPRAAAATVFAILMAVVNLAAAVAEASGGYAYQVLGAAFGADSAYRVIVLASAAIVAFCWCLVRPLTRAWAVHAPAA